MRPAVIEKDYYVTEALRIIAATVGDKVIFKGGTSLSKGWNLIERFSEDVDIFMDPQAFTPALGKRAIDRELKELRDSIGKHPALIFMKAESQTIGGFGRSDRFSFGQLLGGPGEVAGHVLVEAGTASGREPTVTIELRSYLSSSRVAISCSTAREKERGIHCRDLRTDAVKRRLQIRDRVALLSGGVRTSFGFGGVVFLGPLWLLPEADNALDALLRVGLVVEGGDHRRARARPLGDVAVIGIGSEIEPHEIPVWRRLLESRVWPSASVRSARKRPFWSSGQVFGQGSGATPFPGLRLQRRARSPA